MALSHLCFILFLTVVTVDGVMVNGDCSQDTCDAGLTCQDNKCKKKVGQSCGSTNECVTNSQCSNQGTCVCNDPFVSPESKTICGKPAHVGCEESSECVPNAECVDVTTSGVTRKLCQCNQNFEWSVNDLACNAARRLPVSLLMLIASIFVTSRFL